MKAMITKIFLCLLLFCGSVEASQLGALRSRLNFYLSDTTNTMIPSYIKDSVMNVAQRTLAASFPVHLDTLRQAITADTRLYALPSDYAGFIYSMHKNDKFFTEIPRVPTDSLPEVVQGVLNYYSTRHTTLILHPMPIAEDTVFYWYAKLPPDMVDAIDPDTVECRLLDYFEEALVLLTASKCWNMIDLQSGLAEKFNRLYMEEAQRVTRTAVEKPRP